MWLELFYSQGIDLHWTTESIPTSFRAVLARLQENSISRPHGNWMSCASPLCQDPSYMYMELFMCTKRAIIEITPSCILMKCPHQNQSWVTSLQDLLYIKTQERQRKKGVVFLLPWFFCLICQKRNNFRLSQRKITVVPVTKISRPTEHFSQFSVHLFQ